MWCVICGGGKRGKNEVSLNTGKERKTEKSTVGTCDSQKKKKKKKGGGEGVVGGNPETTSWRNWKKWEIRPAAKEKGEENTLWPNKKN